MESMEQRGRHEKSACAMMDWATMGMPATLAASVQGALHAIVTTSRSRGASDEWVLFGEVTNVLDGSPLQVQVRHTNVMFKDHEVVDDPWAQSMRVCPVMHCGVDLTPSVRVGILTKPSDRCDVGKIVADAALPIWNISTFDKHLPWHVTHLFSGAYEDWLRARSKPGAILCLACLCGLVLRCDENLELQPQGSGDFTTYPGYLSGSRDLH